MEKVKTDRESHPADASMEQKILAVAEKLFLQNGYELTSTTWIAKEAGRNQALVHYYFRTKERLFNTIFGDKMKKVLRQLLSLETGEGSFEDKITRMVGVHFDVVRDNPSMPLFVINEFTRNPGRFDDLIRELGDLPAKTFAAFRQDIQREIEAGRIREVAVIDLILNIISLNVFLFTVKPIFGRVWNLEDKEIEQLLDTRKQEIVKTVLLSLRP